MSEELVDLAAPAKVNLYLKVTGRRADGYHYIATLMQKISLADRIVLRKAAPGVRIHCPDSNLPTGESNLVYRAASLFLQTLAPRLGGQTGVDITLYKSIPVAAGLGGGSSDAAAVLKGLDRLYATGCGLDELKGLGGRLGADVPLFIEDWPIAWATGIGDLLEKAVPLTGYRIVLVNPGFSVSTGWVYENFALTVGEKINNLTNFHNESREASDGHIFTQRQIRPEELVNDLEKVTAGHYEEITRIKSKLLKAGAQAALMTGSGPTVFGLFPINEADQAAVCTRELKRQYQYTYLVAPLTS